MLGSTAAVKLDADVALVPEALEVMTVSLLWPVRGYDKHPPALLHTISHHLSSLGCSRWSYALPWGHYLFIIKQQIVPIEQIVYICKTLSF